MVEVKALIKYWGDLLADGNTRDNVDPKLLRLVSRTIAQLKRLEKLDAD